MNAIDLMPRRFALLPIQLRPSRARQPLGGPVHNGCHHLQIAQQFGGQRRRFRLHLRLRFEKQLRLIEEAFPDRRRARAPGRIQAPGLPRVAAMLSEYRGHPLAILQAEARHRNQKLHRHMRRDLALAHLRLDGFGQKFDQRQPPRHPTHAAVEPARQLVEAVAKALLHLLEQPALFQRALLLGETQPTVQQQGLGLAHRPHHRFHGVPAQLPQRRDALIAVDDHVTVGLAFGRHHHDRRLLPRFG